jgi:hypothetical protein
MTTTAIPVTDSAAPVTAAAAVLLEAAELALYAGNDVKKDKVGQKRGRYSNGADQSTKSR